MRDHVKALRKTFQSRTKNGLLVAACNCAKCGITAEESGRKLELHHIVSLRSLEPDDSFDPNVQENLITLCHRCHQSFHKCYEDSYEGSITDWLENVPVDELDARFRDYRRTVQARNEMHRQRHRYK